MDSTPPQLGSLDFVVLTLDAATNFLIVSLIFPADMILLKCMIAGMLSAAGVFLWFKIRPEFT